MGNTFLALNAIAYAQDRAIPESGLSADAGGYTATKASQGSVCLNAAGILTAQVYR